MLSNNNKQVKTDTLSTNATVVGEPVSIKVKITKVWDSVAPAITGIIFGGLISLALVLIVVSSVLAGRSNSCDALGDRLGYASQYEDKQCQFKVNDKWVDVNTLSFKLENGSK
jgi:hypothetical protein